jgi:hypothetical protein
MNIPGPIRKKLVELWKAHETAQANYVAARASADLTKIYPVIEHLYPAINPVHTAQDQLTTIREELRKLYFECAGQGGVERIEAYFTALDNKYGRSGRYTFVSKTGEAGKAADLAANLARDRVNKLTRRPHVL